MSRFLPFTSSNDTFTVAIGKSEKGIPCYIVTNTDTGIEEFETCVLLEALSTADYLDQKLEDFLVGDGSKVISDEELAAIEFPGDDDTGEGVH